MNFPKKLFSEVPEQTELVGRDLASALIADPDLPEFVAMYGDLGVGKTAFVRGFCAELCLNTTVKSPTFSLVNEYRCTLPLSRIKKVCHFDMYRITDEDDLYSIGFYDYLNDKVICIAEWCELIPYALPDRYIKVEIEKVDFDNKRQISISLVDNT